MATYAHSITAPALQPRLLPFVFRPVPPVDDPRSAVELLDEIRRTIEGQEVSVQSAPKTELLAEPLLPLVDLAQTLHLRRQLAEAAEHGAALLAALGLPRLVTAEFERHDIVAIGDALDVVIDHLDAVDGDTDIEDGHDAELDHIYGLADDEPSLGAPENHPARSHIDMEGSYHVGRPHHPLGDQTTWAAGGSWDCDAEAVNEDSDDLDRGEMQEGELEPWLGAPEGCQFHSSGDRDLEQNGEIERPWWGPNAAGFNYDGGRYA